MAKNTTKPTDASVADYIASRANAQHEADCRELMAPVQSRPSGSVIGRMRCLTIRWLHRVVLTAAVAVSLGRRDATAHTETSSPARCTMGILPGARDSLTTTLLGRATRDTIEAGGGVVDRSIWQWSRRAIYGQVVRVDSMVGPGADLARRALNARRSTEVLIVPWGNNPGCGIDVWRWSALWTTPDSSGLFSVRLRPESLWVSGRPTFDALFAVNYSYADGPYTVGPHFVFNDPTGAKVKGKSMTPAEVFALYAALPPVGQPSDSLAIAHARAWVRANPSARTRYPGNLILQGWAFDPPR